MNSIQPDTSAIYELERWANFGKPASSDLSERVQSLADQQLLSSWYYQDLVDRWNLSNSDKQINIPELSGEDQFALFIIRVKDFVIAVFMEFVSLVAASILYPATVCTDFHDDAPGAANQSPVIWVHGYLSNPTIWPFLMSYISGKRPQYTTNFPICSEGIKEDAEKLRETVNKALQGKATKDIDLVGHSRGGLVSIYYAVKLASEDGVNVKSITTLGSPHTGTKIGHIALFGNGNRELVPGSSFLNKHKERVEQLMDDRSINYYNIAGEMDWLVPYSSVTLGRSTDSLSLPHISHCSCVFSPTVGRFLREKLVVESLPNED